jgi:hypothetical protein
LAWLRGGGGQGDGVAELFELVDQTTGLALRVTAADEEVVAEVLEALPGAQQVPSAGAR